MIELYTKYPILIKAINFINISNGRSNSCPYHGIDHLFEVFKMVHNIILNNTIYEYDVNYKLELYIAALFHDYAHSGGVLTDDKNIINALEGLYLFHQANPYFDLSITTEIIKATEYPYSIKDEDIKLFEQRLIRDADMCYLFDDLSVVKLYYGLRVEFKKDLNEFYNNQYNFLNNVQFYNEYYNNLWNTSVKDIRLKELQLLKDNV